MSVRTKDPNRGRFFREECICAFCREKFYITSRYSGPKPKYCCNAHKQKAYRESKKD